MIESLEVYQNLGRIQRDFWTEYHSSEGIRLSIL